MHAAQNKRTFERRHLYEMSEVGKALGYRTERARRFLRRMKVPIFLDGTRWKVTRADIEKVMGAAAPHVLAELDSNYG